MYQPPHFIEDRLDVQHALIKAHPFGLLISVGADGPEANGLPFHLDEAAGPLGTLRVHMARANGQWRSIDGQKVLVVFQGPQAYISPSLYATKRETGKVVPTWNYCMVQAQGVARVHEDSLWLHRQIIALTKGHEETRITPWAVSDAPDNYIQSQIKGIVGIEIEISAISGKWKMSQNRPEADRRGVAEGLDDPQVIDLVKQYGNILP
jgi:transcriptional regulator